jgi:hypothetical protein
MPSGLSFSSFRSNGLNLWLDIGRSNKPRFVTPNYTDSPVSLGSGKTKVKALGNPEETDFAHGSTSTTNGINTLTFALSLSKDLFREVHNKNQNYLRIAIGICTYILTSNKN